MTAVWQDEAACRGMDPEMFYTERGESTRDPKATCAVCPVTAECLQFALDNREKFGVWGGLSERERRRLRRTMPHAQPWVKEPVHGTLGGYRAHLRHGTPTCQGCRDANAIAQQLRKERKPA
jgi:WhiB family redox-sensing transcriptional regulator